MCLLAGKCSQIAENSTGEANHESTRNDQTMHSARESAHQVRDEPLDVDEEQVLALRSQLAQALGEPGSREEDDPRRWDPQLRLPHRRQLERFEVVEDLAG